VRATILALVSLSVVSACSDAPVSAPRHGLEVVAGDHHPPRVLTPTSLKFAVIGDSGRWSQAQRETAAQLTRAHEHFPFELVLMLGDNNYGDGSPESYSVRFEEPYKPLIDAHVRFFASLGNHDPPDQREYSLFNMSGRRYYTFERRFGVLPPLVGGRAQFYALDTVNLTDDQLSWVDRELSTSIADWKILFFHHPIYTSGRYASASALTRRALESIFIEHQADVVFSGHEHLYERVSAQSGVVYFVAGASGSVRVGDLQPAPFHAAGYDRDLSFMLVEIAGDTMYFRAVSRTGETVDGGKIVKKAHTRRGD
jgi:3',5'-cyclic AMP phosphodiesterase CpdA